MSSSLRPSFADVMQLETYSSIHLDLTLIIKVAMKKAIPFQCIQSWEEFLPTLNTLNWNRFFHSNFKNERQNNMNTTVTAYLEPKLETYVRTGV